MHPTVAAPMPAPAPAQRALAPTCAPHTGMWTLAPSSFVFCVLYPECARVILNARVHSAGVQDKATVHSAHSKDAPNVHSTSCIQRAFGRFEFTDSGEGPLWNPPGFLLRSTIEVLAEPPARFQHNSDSRKSEDPWEDPPITTTCCQGPWVCWRPPHSGSQSLPSTG